MKRKREKKAKRNWYALPIHRAWHFLYMCLTFTYLSDFFLCSLTFSSSFFLLRLLLLLRLRLQCLRIYRHSLKIEEKSFWWKVKVAIHRKSVETCECVLQYHFSFRLYFTSHESMFFLILFSFFPLQYKSESHETQHNNNNNILKS